MSYKFPASGLTSDQLIRLADSDLDLADSLDAALAAIVSGGDSALGSNLSSDTEFQWVDHWLIGRELHQGNGWDGIPLGTPPYSLTLQGTGSSLTPVTGTQRVVVVQLFTGTTVTGYSGVSTSATLSNIEGLLNRSEFEAIVAVPTLSTALQGFLATVGLVGTAPGYMVAFEYDRENVNGANAGKADKWQVVTMEAGTATRRLLDGTGGTVDSPVAASAWPSTNIYKLKCVMDYEASEARFYINDVLVHTLTTNLPTHSLAGSVDCLKSVGTTSRSICLDWTRLYTQLATAQDP